MHCRYGIYRLNGHRRA